MDYIKETKDFLSKYNSQEGYQKFLSLNLLFKHLKDNGFKSSDYSSELVDAVVELILLTDKAKAQFRKVLVRYIDEACKAAFSEEKQIKKKKKVEKIEKKINSIDDLTPDDIPDQKIDLSFYEGMGIEPENE